LKAKPSFVHSLRTPSLFTQIFLWFWAAMVLIGLGLMGIEAITQSEQREERWRASTSDAMALYAQTAVETLHGEGQQELDAYLKQIKQGAQIRAWLFDSKGHIISGEPLSVLSELEADCIKRLTTQALRSDHAEFEPYGQITLVAHGALSTQKTHYVLTGELPTANFGFWAVEPRIHALRLLAIILVAGLICGMLSRHLTRPIETLRSATQRLAEGDMSARVGTNEGSGNDELTSLSRDFDSMAERIQALLSEQNRLLDEQNRLIQGQRRLLRDVSHELRSPLARLNVALELARDAVHDGLSTNPTSEVAVNAAQSSEIALNRIEEEAETLREMVDQVLSLSHLESGLQKPTMEPVDLAALIQMVADATDFEARSTGRSVRIVACEPSQINGSLTLLRSAIENVVRNAVRYTSEGTAIEISLLNTPIEAVISVRDYGAGLPESELEAIFRPFYRVSGARERESGGTGLGLSITEHSVRLHDGQVRAYNAPDTGLIVEMRLPSE